MIDGGEKVVEKDRLIGLELLHDGRAEFGHGVLELTGGAAGTDIGKELPGTVLEQLTGFERKIAEDVAWFLDQVGALTDEEIGPPALLGRDVAGDGEYFPALVERKAGRDGAAGVLGAFHNQDAIAEAADDPVADGEVLRIAGSAEGEFRKDQAVVGDLFHEALVFGGVDDINATTEDGDGVAFDVEGAAVGGSIDAAGEATGNGESGGGEVF